MYALIQFLTFAEDSSSIALSLFMRLSWKLSEVKSSMGKLSA